jgi:hypothetical protein
LDIVTDSSNNNVTLIWDVDDVLNNLTYEWVESQFSDPLLTYNAISDDGIFTCLGMTKKNYLSSLDEFRMSGCFAQMSPRKDVLEWFQSYGNKARHVALTSTPLRAAPISAEWVLRHFGHWIRTFHVVPSERSNCEAPLIDSDKGEALRYLGLGDVMIDDRLGNLSDAANAGLSVIRFPRPWNGGGPISDALNKLTFFLTEAPTVSNGVIDR